MLAIREQSWLFPSDFPLRDMQNTVKCPCTGGGLLLGHSLLRVLHFRLPFWVNVFLIKKYGHLNVL